MGVCRRDLLEGGYISVAWGFKVKVKTWGLRGDGVGLCRLVVLCLLWEGRELSRVGTPTSWFCVQRGGAG